MVDEFEFGVILGSVLTVIIFSLILKIGTVWLSDVHSEKDFIQGNVTYKCTKTNELIEGK